ncbi:MAG: pirin family protein [Acidobacteriota bacterium]
MIAVRRAADRGGFDFGWLDTRHTFSFGEYHDPAHMGFRALRVINDDRVGPGQGFGSHPHRDMEIVTIVLEGALAHRDSLGTGSVIRPGEVQRMSAGTGIIHSEMNASESEPVHFLQIWIVPSARGSAPGYEQKAFPESERLGKLRLVGSQSGRDGSLRIHQDVDVHAATLRAGDRATLALRQGRHAWVQVASGSVDLGSTALAEGDGAAVTGEPAIALAGVSRAELVVFDLA